MPKGKLFIRKTEAIMPVDGSLSGEWVDAFIQWGVSLSQTALSTLMTPAPNKEPLENKSRIAHGKSVVRKKELVMKDERDVSLEMHIIANSVADFMEKYSRFCSEVLDAGFLELKTSYQPDVIYKMTYLNCTQFSELAREMAKFTLRLNEPNPDDRTIEEEE